MFLVLGDIDHLVVIRGALQGLYLNTVERGISILNLGLLHVSIKQGLMPPWAEKRVKSASTMKEICSAADKFGKERAAICTPSKTSGTAPSTVIGMIGDSVDAVMTNKEIGVNVASEQSGTPLLFYLKTPSFLQDLTT